MLPIQQQKVVIIGHSSTLRLGMVRAIAEFGCEISVIVLTYSTRFGLRKPFDCYSRYISHVYYCPAKDGEGIIQLLLDKCKNINQKVVLIPTCDFSAVTIDNKKDCLSEYFLYPHISGSLNSIQYWMDKENQKELARTVGLNVPKSHKIDILDGNYTLPDGIEYPCFTKPVYSIVGGKGWFRRCNNRGELQQTFDTILATHHNASILVEDYKEIETEYAVLGFSDGKEVLIPGVITLTRQTVSHFGVAMTGKVIPVIGFEELLEQFRMYVLKIGFVGVFDIDFYYSRGQFYFGEMNLRPGGSGYAVTKLGVNLPAMLVRHLRGESTSGMNSQIENSATFCNERMCSDDWYLRVISSREYHKIVSSADICFVKDEYDTKPHIMFEVEHYILKIKKAIRKIISHKKLHK